MEENKTNTKISISSLKKNFDENKTSSKESLKDKEDEVLSPLNNTIVTEEEALAEKEALKVERKVKIKPLISISKNTEETGVTDTPVIVENIESPLPLVSNKKIWISAIKKQITEASSTPIISADSSEIEKVDSPLVETSSETSPEESTMTTENVEEPKAPLSVAPPIPEESSEIFTNYTPYFDKRKDFLLKKVELIKNKVKTNWKFIAITIVLWIMIWASMIFIDPSQHSFNNYKTSLIDAGNKIKSWEKVFSFPWEVEIKTIDVPDIIVDTVKEEPTIVEPVEEDTTPIIEEETSSGTTVETIISPITKEKEEVLKEVTKEIIKSYFKNIKFQE